MSRETHLVPEDPAFEHVRSHCVDFLQIEQNDAQFESLVERVKKSEGAIDLIVHPFYEKMVDLAEADPKYKREGSRTHEYKDVAEENYTRIDEIQKNLIDRAKSEDGNPCFVMETQATRALLLEELKDGAGLEMKNNLYIVDTHDGDPTPKVSPPGQYWDDYKQGYELDEGWNRFIMLLRISGVKKVNLGGMYLDINYHDHDVRERYSACVGTARRFLLDAGFEIEISDYAYPLNGKEDVVLKKAFDEARKAEMRKLGIDMNLNI